ncbi:hypothetical protein MTR67_033865 [Solanum verrucosum]|uniref:Late blight resistance protein homolog R1A-10 n=1 Tax=Solanum verrucosum TaxID=315347 RepID=A0AAF0U6S1_SOLVR|nr:hypothetical protein MTR67_033865 [Solanum verrucosum]
MAVYAAVTSLMGTVHLISQSSLDFQESNKECSKSLHEKVGSLLEFLDNSDNELMKDLQKKVKDLANEIEDEVESQVLQIMEKDEHIQTEANERLRKILEQAIEDIDSVNEELRKQRNKNNNSLSGNCSLGGSTSPRSRVSTLENDMVGHSDEQARVRGELIGHSSLLEVISITGMGGIGKSTFAKTMFSDPSVMGFFDVRGWITVSKDYSLRKMLLSLLQDAIGVNEVLDKKPDDELADCLQKCLKGRRYLIVVDDIWSTKAWEDIRQWFPENNNRSRILLTTRIMEVARDASYPKNLFPMRFLDPEESWNLFCQKAISKNDCPTEFESVGKVVVENCKGLPLMISVVAGSLSSKRTLDEWNEVAQSVSSLVNLDDYQRCSGVLALSYNHLPSHLKACFLYFGVFKKASEFSIENLIRLWIAEGLFKLWGIGDLEKEACSLLHDLIDRSLIVVCKHSLDGKIKTCRIHDLLHDLCLRESPVPCVGSFPPNLKKLTLQGTHLLWSKLTIISKLPKLEVLQLKALKLFGDELGETVWKVSEMGFPKLKFLLLEKKGLKNWKATDDSFPCLERVIIKNCRFLQEIPKEFADSMTLKRIELWGCTPSLVNFAKEIQEEQESLGNNILQVYAYDTIREHGAALAYRGDDLKSEGVEVMD